MPYFSAIFTALPVLNNIERASSSFSLCSGCFSPKVVLTLLRPFLSMSRTLSRGVPMNRWLGLTQDGLSHEWQTKRPSGFSPLSKITDARCAPITFPPHLNVPYPLLAMVPPHSQHPSPWFLMRFRNTDRTSLLCALFDWYTALQAREHTTEVCSRPLYGWKPAPHVEHDMMTSVFRVPDILSSLFHRVVILATDTTQRNSICPNQKPA